jgi:hypothetical protein
MFDDGVAGGLLGRELGVVPILGDVETIAGNVNTEYPKAEFEAGSKDRPLAATHLVSSPIITT